MINNENNEILFWKIFHNKVLRNNIIHQIEELNKLKSEKKKFKEINSLNFFITHHQQIPLLKCKLKANEEINICTDSLSELLKYMLDSNSKDNNNNKVIVKEEKQYIKPIEYEEFNKKEEFGSYFENIGEYKKGDEYIEIDLDKEYENQIKKIENEKEMIENSKYIFLLLSKFKLNELMKFRIIDIIIQIFHKYNFKSSSFILEDDNQAFNQLLFNEPYCNSIIIDEETIELAIKKSTASLLNKLLSNLKKRNLFNQVITDNIKNYSISWVNTLKGENNDQMFEFILNDQSLYNIPPPPPPSTSLSPPNKRLKLSTAPTSSPKTQDDNQFNEEVVKIEYYNFFKINSQVVQIKLLNLNYLNLETNHGQEFKEKIIDFFSRDQGDDDFQRIRELHKLFSVESDIYQEYLLKYDQAIDELKDAVLYRYLLFSKSVNALKYLLSKKEMIKQLQIQTSSNFFENNYSKKLKEKYQFSNEFIELYIENYHYFLNEYEFNIELFDFIFSIKSNQEYEEMIKSIKRTKENKELTELIPEKWCEIPIEMKEKLIDPYGFLIQDTETIDFIHNQSNYITLWHNLKNIKENKRNRTLFFKFETIQLIDYSKSKSGANGHSIFFSNYPKGNKTGILVENREKTTSLVISKFQIEPYYYIYPYAVAINNCDIESLMQIDQIMCNTYKLNNYSSQIANIKFNQFNYYYPTTTKYSKFVRSKIYEAEEIIGYSNQVLINFNNQISNSSNIIRVLNYFNSTGYKLFSKALFIEFIQDLSKLDSSIFNINDLKIDFKLVQNQSLKSFLELFFRSNSNNTSSKQIQIILNNINPFSNELFQSFKEIYSKWSLLITRTKDKSNYHYYSQTNQFRNYSIWCLYYTRFDDKLLIERPFTCFSYESSVEIQSCIEIILNQINSNKTNISFSLEIYEIIQSIINYLFKRLIKVKQVSIDQVKNIYEFIKSTWLSITGGTDSGTEFIFEHTQYHVFFYLGIRSIEFINYIMNSSYIFSNDGIIIQGCENEFFSIGSSTQNLLDPTVYTYDYIFNTASHDQIFDSIKSNTPFIIKKEYSDEDRDYENNDEFSEDDSDNDEYY